jgi:membrane protein DedA with SNARE-associated domain
MTGEISEITQHTLAEVSRFEPLLLHYGVAVIMVAVAAEGFGIPVPGQTLLVVGAVLAARGKFDITWLLLLAWFATVIGNLIGYYLGRLGGRRLLARLPVNPDHLKRMEALCVRHGHTLVLVARFIDGLRQLSNFIVGILQMPPALFLLMTSVGAALWVGVWGLGAYLLDRHIHALALGVKQLAPYTWAATLLLVLLLGIYVFHRNTRRKGGQP